MPWIGTLITGLIAFLKGFFGWDKPVETVVNNAKPEKPIDNRPDDDLLAELGVFVQPDDRAESGRTVHDSASREASPSVGEQKPER